jgi:hypothetical protein
MSRKTANLRLGRTELVTLRRFFRRGCRCASENHDRYEYPVSTHQCGNIGGMITLAILSLEMEEQND